MLVVAYHNLAVAQEFADDAATAATRAAQMKKIWAAREGTAPARGLSAGGVPAMPLLGPGAWTG
eukprot:gene37070-26248_t